MGKVKIGSTSGDVELRLSGETDSVKIGSTSGTVVLETEKAGKIEAGSTSGSVEVRAEEAGEVKIGTTSGSIWVTVKKSDRISVSSTSGSITAGLSEDPGFTADINTVSGSVDCSVKTEKNGNRYICGNGSTEANLSTVSGSIRIEAAE